MAYADDITSLSPDHLWKLDGSSLDSVSTANGVDTSIIYTSAGICEDVTNCAETNAISDRISIPATTDINNSAQARKTVCGWFMPTAIQNPPKNIYGEGDASQSFRFILGWGNNIMFEVDTATSVIQIFGDVPLTVNRPYHLAMVFEGTSYANKVRAYLDGVEQLNAEPTSRVSGVATLPARSVPEFGDPAGVVGVGGVAVVLLAPINGRWNQWASWGDSASAILTTTQIREKLFEKGALPDITISTGTKSVMQTALEAYDDTTRPNTPLCIRINDVTGSGDLELDATDIIFDELASIHVQWMGTGELTWNNLGTSNASIFSTPNGGTVVPTTETTITATIKDADTLLPIVGARVLIEIDTGYNPILGAPSNTIYDMSTFNIIDSLPEGYDPIPGSPSNTIYDMSTFNITNGLPTGTVYIGVTDSNGEVTTTYTYIKDQALKGKVRKSSSSTYYKTSLISEVITENGLDIIILMVRDE